MDFPTLIKTTYVARVISARQRITVMLVAAGIFTATAIAQQAPATNLSNVNSGATSGQARQDATVKSAIQPTTVGEKKPGMIRVAVVIPKADFGPGAGGPEVGQSLQNMLVRYLSGPNIEVVQVTAMLPAQVDAEINAKQCDFILYTSFTQKRGGMSLLRSATTLASMVPMVGMAGSAAASMAGGSAISGLAQTASLLKAKSDLALEYKLNTATTNSTVAAESIKAKVKADGADAISPLMEQAATNILSKLASAASAQANH